MIRILFCSTVFFFTTFSFAHTRVPLVDQFTYDVQKNIQTTFEEDPYCKNLHEMWHTNDPNHPRVSNKLKFAYIEDDNGVGILSVDHVDYFNIDDKTKFVRFDFGHFPFVYAFDGEKSVPAINSTPFTKETVISAIREITYLTKNYIYPLSNPDSMQTELDMIGAGCLSSMLLSVTSTSRLYFSTIK